MQWVRPLPEEFFLLAHDDYTGSPVVNVKVLASGLAGAMLAELLITERIKIPVGENDRVYVADSRQWRGDSPAVQVTMREMGAQSQAAAARAWVEYLRDALYGLVGDDLAQRNVVRAETTGLLRKSTKYVALDPLDASRARVGLRYVTERRSVGLDERTMSLAGLATVTGLVDTIAEGANRDARDGLRRIGDALKGDLAAVVASVDKAVAAILLVPDR